MMCSTNELDWFGRRVNDKERGEIKKGRKRKRTLSQGRVGQGGGERGRRGGGGDPTDWSNSFNFFNGLHGGGKGRWEEGV